MKKFMTLVMVVAMFTSMATSAFAAGKGTGEKVVVNKMKQVGEHSIAYTVRETVESKKDKKPKQTILVIHGAASNANSTETLAVALADKFPKSQVVQIDLPAHGKSTGPVLESIFDMASVVEDFVAEGVESGEFSKFILPVGVSMGGSVSQLLALSDNKELKHIKKVALVSSSSDWTHLAPMASIPPEAWTETYSQMIQADFAVNTTPEEQAEFAKVFPSYSASVEVSLADSRALAKFNITDQLKNLKEKVLLISGDADTVALIDRQHTLKENIKKSELIVIPTETHTYSMKKPAEVADMIFKHFGE